MKGDLKRCGQVWRSHKGSWLVIAGAIIAPGPEEMGCSMRMRCDENRITATGESCGRGHS